MLGFEGSLCELETNECSSFPCASGEACVDLISDYRCHCPQGFEGMRPSDASVSLFTAISMASHRNIRFESSFPLFGCWDTWHYQLSHRKFIRIFSLLLFNIRCIFHIEMWSNNSNNNFICKAPLKAEWGLSVLTEQKQDTQHNDVTRCMTVKPS